MFHLSNVFLFSVFGLVGLASVMLAFAEGAVFPEAATVPLCVAAYVLTERRKRMHLPTAAANCLGLLAFLLASFELFSGNIEARLLSGAHLIVYLSWIALFQEKTHRVYWTLCALSVLQVAVGSVLTRDSWYGAMLVGYLVSGIWTLSVFSLVQARQQVADSGESGDSDDGGRQDPPVAGLAPARRRRGDRLADFASVLRRPSTARGGVQFDPHQSSLGLRLMLGTLVTSALALSVSAVFFTLIPRIWIGKLSIERDSRANAAQIQTGFVEQIELGDIGEILESREQVLSVRFVDNVTGEAVDIEKYAVKFGYDEPLLRGLVLSRYENGRWTQLGQSNPQQFTDWLPRNSIRQEIRLQPLGGKTLFAIHPIMGMQSANTQDPLLAFDAATLTLSRAPQASAEREIEYIVASPRPSQFNLARAFHDGLPAVSNDGWNSGSYRELRPEKLRGLVTLARRVAGADGAGPPPSELEMVKRLVAHLRDSGEFSYSLTKTVDDATIDPIEDFLLNRKTGHCEYYASALALMLRAVGVPSRIVSGFKGGTLDPDGQTYMVEQRHAHVWVEARLDESWVVLDPTPPFERAKSVRQVARQLISFRNLLNQVRSFWDSNILNVTLAKQQEGLYVPLEGFARSMWNMLRGRDSTFAEIAAPLKEILLSPKKWLSWQGGLLSFVLLVVVSLSVWASRRFGRVWKRISSLLPGQASDQGRVEFYERFRKICREHGLVRAPHQTQREFARAVDAALRGATPRPDVPEFGGGFTSSFYGVRFGSESLPPERILEIDGQLSRLQESLQARAADKRRR